MGKSMQSRLTLRNFPCLWAPVISLVLALPAGAQSSVKEAFPYAYDSNIQLSDLAGGKVLGQRVPSEGRALSMTVESYYLLPDSPANVIKLMIDSTSAAATEASDTLSIEGHYIISEPPRKEDFSPFSLSGEKSSSFGFGGTRMLDADVAKLNLSSREAEILKKAADQGAAGIDAAWKEIFLNRATTFRQGGLLKSAPYESNGKPFDVRQELVALLKSQPKVLNKFQNILGVIMTGKPLEDILKPSHYWQNHKLQGQRVVTMAYITAYPSGSGYLVADCTYYVTGGYYTSLILYELQPVSYEEKNQTLVWRGDYVISESINFLKGIERMAAEKIMLLEIKKSIESFIDEVGQKN